jgi:hypothetical protein
MTSAAPADTVSLLDAIEEAEAIERIGGNNPNLGSRIDKRTKTRWFFYAGPKSPEKLLAKIKAAGGRLPTHAGHLPFARPLLRQGVIGLSAEPGKAPEWVLR